MLSNGDARDVVHEAIRLHLEMNDALYRDVSQWEAILAEKDSQISRRAYTRAIFAYAEGMIYQTKQRVMELHPIMGRELSYTEFGLLNEITCNLNENGTTFERPFFVRIADNFRFTVNIVEKVFGKDLNIDFGEDEWDSFVKSVRIRNRLTHPKKLGDIEIDDEKMIQITRAFRWFHEKYHLIFGLIREATSS